MRQIGRKVRQILSLVLAIVLIVTMIPQSAVSVYGEEFNEEITAELNVDSDVETLVDLEEEPDVETEEIEESEIESADADEVTDSELESDIAFEDTADDEDNLEEEENIDVEESFEEDVNELRWEECEELLTEVTFSEDDEMELCGELNIAKPDVNYALVMFADNCWQIGVIGTVESFSKAIAEAKKQGYECWLNVEWGADSPIDDYSFQDENDGYYMRSQAFEIDNYFEEYAMGRYLFSGDNIPNKNCNIKARCQFLYGKTDDEVFEVKAESEFSDFWTGSKYFYSVGSIESVPDSIFYFGRSDIGAILDVTLSEDLVNKVKTEANEKGGVCRLELEYGTKIIPEEGYLYKDEEGFYISSSSMYVNKSNGIWLFDNENIPNGYFDIKARCRFVYEETGEYGSVFATSDFTDWWEDRVALKRSDVPVPSIDKTYGYDGIKYIYAGDKLSISFRVPKNDYANIKLEDDEILKVLFSYGAKIPNLKEDINPITEGEFEGYYRGWNAETVKQGNELRTAPVTGGVEGDEIHDLSDNYITVTVPLFGHVSGDNPIDLPYDGYKDGIYLGLEYVIMDKADCPDQDYETIDWNKAFEGEYSAKLYKNPTTIVSLQYDADEVDAGIYEGDNKVEPYSVTEPSGDIPNTEYYALDKTVSYNFKTEAKGSGYKINKVAYTAGKTKANWAASKSFSPVDGALIAVDSQAIYAAVLTKEGETEALSPDAKGVYSASFMDTINFEIKKGNTTITPAKIVTKVGKKVIETIDNGESSPKFYDFGAYYGQKVTIELYEEGIANAVTTCSVQVTAPISSVTLKNKNVLIPAIDGGVVTSVVTVNKGANVNNLGFKFEGTDAATGDPAYVDSVDYLDVTFENGVLTIAPKEKCEVGRCVDIIFYDKENTKTDWDKQVIKDKKYTITAKAPAWANKTPNASLVSANDYQLEFKVTAPSGVKFDGKYWAAVKLSSNKNTAKGIKEGLDVNDNVKYVKINPDGTISQVLLNAFNYKEGYGSGEVTTLGEGCGTSVTADVYIVRTLNGAEPEADESNILASTKHRTLTVSTKKPYYADKITLKKTAKATKLYALEQDILVATVDFGKNATYTRLQDWEIANADELSAQGITVVKDSNSVNGIVVTTNQYALGTYSIVVKTVPPVGGVPATASVNITVLPTAIWVEANDIVINHKLGTALSYKLSPVVHRQDGTVIKNAALGYEIGKKDGSGDYKLTDDFSVAKGTIKSSKNFAAGNNEYAIKFAATLGQTIETEWIPVTFKEYEGTDVKINTLKLGIEAPDNSGEIIEIAKNANVPFGTTIYYKAYNSATPGAADNTDWSELDPNQYKDAEEKDLSVTSDTLTLSGPNFYSIAENKAPKTVTLKATSIDGTKASASFKLTYAEDSDEYNIIRIRTQGVSDIDYKDKGNNTYELNLSKFTPDKELLACVEKDEDANSDAYKSMVDATIDVKGAKIVYDYYGKKQQTLILLTSKEATLKLKKAGKVVYTLIVKNDCFTKPAAPAKKSISINGNTKLYRGYNYSKDAQIVIQLNAPLKDKSGNLIEKSDVTMSVESSQFSSDAWIENAEYICDSDKKTACVLVTVGCNDEYWRFYDKGACECTFRYLSENSGQYLTKSSTVVSFAPSDFKKSFALKTSQKMTRTVYKDGTYTDSVLVPNYTATGVESVTFTELLNYNAKGTYTTFNTDYHLYEDQISLASSDSYPVDKKGKPLSSEGYIKCHVKFQNGDEQDYITKVKIDWNLVKSNQASATNGRL